MFTSPLAGAKDPVETDVDGHFGGEFLNLCAPRKPQRLFRQASAAFSPDPAVIPNAASMAATNGEAEATGFSDRHGPKLPKGQRGFGPNMFPFPW